jgi:transcriptional regulator with XRE-family HTH domain
MSDEPLRIQELGLLIREKRQKEGLSLRDAAHLAEVSFNTLSRVERGHIPDVGNLKSIVAWLGLSPERFFGPLRKSWEPTPDVIAHHLRADLSLSPEAAEKIASIVGDLYSALARKELTVHLRAAATFEPEAASLFAELLGQIQSALVSEDSER